MLQQRELSEMTISELDDLEEAIINMLEALDAMPKEMQSLSALHVFEVEMLLANVRQQLEMTIKQSADLSCSEAIPWRTSADKLAS